MISIEEFTIKYINVDFDNILLDMNNPSVNSNQDYLQFKNVYLENTMNNLCKLEELLPEYNRLHCNKTSFCNRITYTVVCKVSRADFSKKIKELVIDQNLHYTNLMSHINLLNENNVSSVRISRYRLHPSRNHHNKSN